MRLKISRLLFFSVCMVLLSCNREPDLKLQLGILIENITIISANENDIDQYLGYVVIDQGHIIYANRLKPSLTGSFKVVKGDGKFIIPGLIDSHVHLANTAGFNGTLKKKYPNLVTDYFEQLPKSYLYHGFTTLIDVNNYAPHIIDKINKTPLHPDIYTCGNQVQVMDDFMMAMEDYPKQTRLQFQFLHDKYNTDVVFPDSINLVNHTANSVINHIVSKNGIGVKLAYEDEASGLQVNWAKPSKDIISDLVKEAQSHNLPVLLHAPSLEGHQMGLASGVQIFAHGLWNWTKDFDHEFNNLKLTQEHLSVLDELANKQLGYQLTLRTIIGEEDLIKGEFQHDNHLENIYPKAYLDVLKSEEGRWGKDKIFGRAAFLKATNPSFYKAIKSNHSNDNDMWLAVYDLYKTRLNTVAKYLNDHQANFLLGSDTPAMNMLSNPPGYNGYLEMQHMFNAGISLEHIFRAATYNNAKAFHLSSQYGSIKKGAKANLLILNDNPLKNVEAYNSIEHIVLHGKLLDRKQLSAKLN